VTRQKRQKASRSTPDAKRSHVLPSAGRAAAAAAASYRVAPAPVAAPSQKHFQAALDRAVDATPAPWSTSSAWLVGVTLVLAIIGAALGRPWWGIGLGAPLVVVVVWCYRRASVAGASVERSASALAERLEQVRRIERFEGRHPRGGAALGLRVWVGEQAERLVFESESDAARATAWIAAQAPVLGGSFAVTPIEDRQRILRGARQRGRAFLLYTGALIAIGLGAMAVGSGGERAFFVAGLALIAFAGMPLALWARQRRDATRLMTAVDRGEDSVVAFAPQRTAGAVTYGEGPVSGLLPGWSEWHMLVRFQSGRTVRLSGPREGDVDLLFGALRRTFPEAKPLAEGLVQDEAIGSS
jgi:hypothetical protein